MSPCCLTGYSFFDVWSLVHLAFWIFAGSTLWALHVNRWLALSSGLIAALMWEVLEHFMAPLHPEIWKDPESWWNAWLSDPLMCVVGVLGIYMFLNLRPRSRT
jgi:hypothetical protein